MKKIFIIFLLFCTIAVPFLAIAKTNNSVNQSPVRSQMIVFIGTVEAIDTDGYSVKVTSVTGHKNFYVDIGKTIVVHSEQGVKNIKHKISNNPKIKNLGNKKKKTVQVGSSVTVRGFLSSDGSIDQAQVTLQIILTKVKHKK